MYDTDRAGFPGFFLIGTGDNANEPDLPRNGSGRALNRYLNRAARGSLDEAHVVALVIEAKVAGGWQRFMCWVGAIMAACGFTWCYLSFLALVGHHFHWLTDEQTVMALSLGYVLLVPFLLFAGYAITLDSWGQAFRQGGVLNYGMAAWNTYASIHNTWSAWRNLGEAFTSLRDGPFAEPTVRGVSRDRDRDRDGGGPIIVLLLVLFVLLAGVLTTAVIIRRVAASEPLPPQPTGT